MGLPTVLAIVEDEVFAAVNGELCAHARLFQAPSAERLTAGWGNIFDLLILQPDAIGGSWKDAVQRLEAPTLLVVNEADDAELDEFLESPLCDFVVLPFKDGHLRVRLHRALKRREACSSASG